MSNGFITAASFEILAQSFLQRSDRDFRALFGVGPGVVCQLWQRCSFPPKTMPKHLLWALLFLKTYATEPVLCSIVGTTRKTFRKWSWPIVKAIAAEAADIVRWENRFRSDTGKTCKVTVDGTDFRIEEPTPFDRKWFSHKFKGAGVRYEVAVCIQTGDIVWTRGPFPCGSWNDLKIFRSKMKNMLGTGEMVEADAGYAGEPGKVRVPGDYVSRVDRRAKKIARARHETVNRRLKQFGCLKQQYRHELRTHKFCFAAVVVCTQLSIEFGELPFQCNY